MADALNNAQIRKLKGLAQKMEASLKVGKQGLSAGFIQSLDEELNRHELVKLKFADHKDERKELAPQLAEKTGAQLVALIGNVVVLFRRNPDPEKQKIDLPAA